MFTKYTFQFLEENQSNIHLIYDMYCPEKGIDDENHFLHNCTIFVNEREKLFTEMGKLLPGFESLSEIERSKLCCALPQQKLPN